MNNDFSHSGSKINSVLTVFCDLFFLGLLWLLTAWPIITLPAASAALYDSVARCVMGDEAGPYARFFRTLWREMGRGLLIAILWILFGIIVWVGHSYLSATAESSTVIRYYLYFFRISLLLPAAILCWLLPLESRFVFRFWQLHKAAVSYAIAYLPRTAGMLGALVAVVVICGFVPALIIFAPGAIALLHYLLIEKVLKENTPKEEEMATSGQK